MKLEEHSLQNEKKEANYEKILFQMCIRDSGADVFGDYEEGYDPNTVSIGKGAESELDLFNKPMVHITYSGKDRTLSMPSKELYKDGKDIEDIKTSDHTWRGYTATSVGYPIAVPVSYTHLDVYKRQLLQRFQSMQTCVKIS